MGGSQSSVLGVVISELEQPVNICAESSGGRFDDIKLIVCSSDIVVFSDPSCGYCYETKELLGQAGLNFTMVNATAGQRQRLKALTGSGSVPSVWVKGKFIGGCNDGPFSWQGVRKTLQSGILNSFLNESTTVPPQT